MYKNIRGGVISVIVPVYNVFPYLSQCLDSILHQTYANLEVIIVDDCSTDRSREICEQYAQRDNRIHLISHDVNSGLSAARNTGLEAATGEYLSFVDSDDWLELDAYEQCLELFDQYPTLGMIKFGFCYSDPDVQSHFLKPEKYLRNGEYFRSYASSLDMAVVWNALYRRAVVSDLRFKDGYLHEDEYYTLELLCRHPNIEIYQLERPLYHYRTGRLGAITEKTTEKHIQDLVRGFCEVYQVARMLGNDTQGLCLLRMLVIYRAKYSIISYHFPQFAPIIERVLPSIDLSCLPTPRELGMKRYTMMEYYGYKRFCYMPRIDYHLQRAIDIAYRILLEPILGRREYS